MKILVSGSTGLVGTAFLSASGASGHQIVRLVRAASFAPQTVSTSASISWDPKLPKIDADADGVDAVVHLAGASIAGRRWSRKRKAELQQSRIDATRNLVTALSELRHRPGIFIAASAIGFYGSRADEKLTESSSAGTDFLATLTREWEAESSRAAGFGARVACLRFGIILSRVGGALPRLALPFRFGVGGRLGSGEQWMSWITLEDVIGVINYVLKTDAASGAINVVGPNPVRNGEFTRALAKALHRPSLFPAPAFALRLGLGEMAEALLLASQRVIPERLQQLRYPFISPNLDSALSEIYR